MLDLLEKMSLQDIVVAIVLLALAAKEVITFYDWMKDRLKNAVHKDEKPDDLAKQIRDLTVMMQNNIDTFTEAIKSDRETQAAMQASIDILMASDKDNIKAYITEKHHYFCYEKGYIDDYSLDCLEKIFKHYLDEGGNSFAEDLMNDMRALPKVSISKNIGKKIH